MFLVLLSGCKELYFKSPQPKGGEQYKGDLIQYLTNSLPNRITSNDNNSLLKDAVNDTLVYIEINQDLITVQIRMKFYNDLIWVEEFDLNDFLHDFYDYFSAGRPELHSSLSPCCSWRTLWNSKTNA